MLALKIDSIVIDCKQSGNNYVLSLEYLDQAIMVISEFSSGYYNSGKIQTSEIAIISVQK